MGLLLVNFGGQVELKIGRPVLVGRSVHPDSNRPGKTDSKLFETLCSADPSFLENVYGFPFGFSNFGLNRVNQSRLMMFS